MVTGSRHSISSCRRAGKSCRVQFTLRVAEGEVNALAVGLHLDPCRVPSRVIESHDLSRDQAFRVDEPDTLPVTEENGTGSRLESDPDGLRQPTSGILAVNDSGSTALVRHDRDHGALRVMHDQLTSTWEPADTPKKAIRPSASTGQRDRSAPSAFETPHCSDGVLAGSRAQLTVAELRAVGRPVWLRLFLRITRDADRVAVAGGPDEYVPGAVA